MTLTVLIPTHGRPVLLGRTLASVAACARPPGYGGCVVVENGPAAGAEAVVAEAAAAHPEAGFRYLHHGRANKSAALNAALGALAASAPSGPGDPEAGAPEGGRLVVFLDDDVRVSGGALVAYAEAGAAHPEAAYFGGPVSCDYEQAPPDWMLPLLPPSARGVDEAESERMGYFLGINWAAWASEVVSAGGFDPSYGPGSATGARGQESDMQRRLRDVGARPVDVPDARVWHYVPRSRSTLAWLRQRQYQGGVSQGLRDEASVLACMGAVARTVASVIKQGGVGTRTSRHAAVGALFASVGRVRGRLHAAFNHEGSDE